MYDLVKHGIVDDPIVEEYQVFHDCGKPLVGYVDDQGRKHFPDHARASYEQFKVIFPEKVVVQELIKMDMDMHILKGEELLSLLRHEHAPTLFFTAIAEIIANSEMFGGCESEGFKIKRKKLVQVAKKFIAEWKVAPWW